MCVCVCVCVCVLKVLVGVSLPKSLAHSAGGKYSAAVHSRVMLEFRSCCKCSANTYAALPAREARSEGGQRNGRDETRASSVGSARR